jgi:hypothetical protein
MKLSTATQKNTLAGVGLKFDKSDRVPRAGQGGLLSGNAQPCPVGSWSGGVGVGVTWALVARKIAAKYHS